MNIKRNWEDYLESLKQNTEMCIERDDQEGVLNGYDKLISGTKEWFDKTGRTELIPLIDSYYLKLISNYRTYGRSKEAIPYCEQLESFRIDLYNKEQTEERLQDVAQIRGILSKLYKELEMNLEECDALLGEIDIAVKLVKLTGNDFYAQNIIGVLQDLLNFSQIGVTQSLEEGDGISANVFVLFAIRGLDLAGSVMESPQINEITQEKCQLFIKILSVLREAGYEDMVKEEAFVRGLLVEE